MAKGEGLTSYVKYLIGFFGVASQDVFWTLLYGGLYFAICYMIGRTWYVKGWILDEAEVGNNFNNFVKEMRENYKK